MDEYNWTFPWLCFQRKVGGAVCHCTCRPPDVARPVGPTWRPEKYQGWFIAALRQPVVLLMHNLSFHCSSYLWEGSVNCKHVDTLFH